MVNLTDRYNGGSAALAVSGMVLCHREADFATHCVRGEITDYQSVDAGGACWKHAISITPLKRSAEWGTATTCPTSVSKTRDKQFNESTNNQ